VSFFPILITLILFIYNLRVPSFFIQLQSAVGVRLFILGVEQLEPVCEVEAKLVMLEACTALCMFPRLFMGFC
jgi:hypothetical protein